MNRKMVLHTIGHMVLLESALLVLPLIIALIKKEYTSMFAFGVTIVIAFAVGMILRFLVRPKKYVIYAKEGFVIAAGSWLMFSLIGCLPFIFSGFIPNFVDAFFETVSGLTTTGATIINDVEVLDKSIHFWRCFTHWIGGMGVIVFVMAIIPSVTDRSIHIMRAEMPGISVDKLVPKANGTAKILYLLYIVLTVFETILLSFGDMTPFQALLHTFSTAGTGGFGMLNDSIASFSPYTQWVITIFMILFGVNFNLYYLLILRKLRTVLFNTELRAYIGIIVGATGICVVSIITQAQRIYETVGDTIRHSAFQVASIMTTTGFTTTDYDHTWPALAKCVLLILMFIGACAGSTGGGMKVVRLIILIKSAGKEFKHLLHPRSVNSVKMEGKSLDNSVVHSVNYYFVVYIMCTFSVFFLVCIFDNKFGSDTLITNFTAAVSCFNNVGPGFGWISTHTYAEYSAFSKIILSIAMLMGRLEIYPILLSVAAIVSKRDGRGIKRNIKTRS